MSASHPHLTHPKYRADIDGLRAVAVLAVVGFHAFPSLIRGGFVGVDVFFVISGFLISTIVFESLDRGVFSFSEFYARRIKRIFPALLLVLIACFTFGWYALLATEYKQLGKHIAAGASFMSNFALWSEAGYFDNAAEVKPLLHLWSLGIEEQFYIIWPFLLWLAWKRKINFLLVAVLVSAVSFYLNLSGIKKDPIATFYSPQTRFWELLCGSLLAWLTLYKKETFTKLKFKVSTRLSVIAGRKTPENNERLFSNILSLLGVLLLSVGFWHINSETAFPGTWASAPVLGAVFIIAAGSNAWFNRLILSNKIFVWFGLISFPLYLWHWPILSFLRIIESEEPSRMTRIAAVLLSIALAWLTYRFAERPIRLGGNDRKKLYGLALLMVACGTTGYITYAAGGFESRVSLRKTAGFVELTKEYPHMPYRNEACDSLYPELKTLFFCLISKESPPEVVILGDSHSNQYYKSLAHKLPNMSVMNLGTLRCLPFSSATYASANNCEPKVAAALKFAIETPSIKTIYLAGYWGALASGGFAIENENFRQPRPLTDNDARTFIEAGKKFLSEITKSGKEIIFINDTPDLNFNIRSCFDSRPLTIKQKEVRETCGISRSEYSDRYKVYADMLSTLIARTPSIKVYSPIDLFCDNQLCRATNTDGKPRYYNSDHLTISGADLVIEDLLRKYPIK
ncbi:acyltransferase family protein [Pseudomonas sp. PDM31]|uniref:acyltransferase family protein n=1 Tax=Pseudomonas sp. PDM31 TaxID=2854778 RepID=UPI001C48BB13|nr:acyltransferase family protein [Pseudomonas sp. PDM31]MBV7478179.1 acyltransferase [Pseudomonas sp. PDM31]